MARMWLWTLSGSRVVVCSELSVRHPALKWSPSLFQPVLFTIRGFDACYEAKIPVINFYNIKFPRTVCYRLSSPVKYNTRILLAYIVFMWSRLACAHAISIRNHWIYSKIRVSVAQWIILLTKVVRSRIDSRHGAPIYFSSTTISTPGPNPVGTGRYFPGVKLLECEAVYLHLGPILIKLYIHCLSTLSLRNVFWYLDNLSLLLLC